MTKQSEIFDQFADACEELAGFLEEDAAEHRGAALCRVTAARAREISTLLAGTVLPRPH